ncbi:oxygen-regulated protein 1-like [Scomber japonicus]|uniref:oxygen-regulated protein 1-like n=1 Tax=Scomber japonicus TaxID=13676 RepID=UPI0023065CC0|nr:oxygen-regulated protein 1-like [Scomber japonicus]
MMNEIGFRRIPPDQLSGSVHTVGTQRHPSVIDPIPSKRVCFYKSGDPQFNGLRMVINNRTFKTFDALLDSLSKKVPLPFGVRNITTPRGVHAVYTLDELEDGKSYICSDSRKVKPINLALARKKLPPWYHARPASSRRRTVQQARFFPGRNVNGPEQVVAVRTPKRLLVFRNGEPSIRHTVLLQKRTTPTFESILGYISGLMEVRVVKLYTPDGRRVDGLPGLILCSGTVVAAGREPFRSANYDAQKSPAPSRLHANRLVPKRLKTLNRKKKLLSYSPKSRNFSPASERYIVSRIHNSIAGSSCELPSNPSNSMELETSRLLGSVAETEHDTCLSDGTGEGMPTEDDIEKSFRVNQDGSMTVEMKVRLTIKEEEIVHWTTTLTRSSVANQLNASSLLVSEPEKCSPESNSLDLQSPAASTDTINRNETKDNNDEDPPSMGSAAFSENSNEEVDIKVPMDVLSPWRAPTPGHKQLTRRQSSLDSLKSVMADRVQQTHNRAMTEQYRMVKQSGTRPVPKPRRLGSVDAKTINSRNVSTFNSASMTEIMQVDSAEEEVTETVVRIYEQQTYQDNFLSNFYTHEASTSGISYSRPATSETGRLSSSNEFEPELWRPSTASEAMSIWRAESMSVMSDLTVPSFKTGAIQATNRKLHFSKSTYGKEKPEQREVNKDKMLSSKPKVINKRVHRLMSPGKRRNKTPAEATEKQKKVKTFSSAGFIKRIYGNKSKPAKAIMKPKRRSIQNSDGGDTTKSSKSSGETIKDLTIPSPQKINISKTVTPETSRLKVSLTEVNQPRATLQRQTSMHPEKNNKNESYDVSESMSMPAFNSSSSVTNEYVENWLEKADLNPTDDSDVESKSLEAVIHEKTENDMFGESESDCGLITVAEEVKCCEKSEMQTPLPENVQVNSVKQRIQSFENKSGSSVETTTAMQQITHGHATSTNTDNCNRYEVNNTEEMKPNSEASPPVSQKSNKKQLSRNLSSETVSESPNKTQSPSDSEYQQSIKSTSEMDERSETSDQSDDNKVNETDDLRKAYQDKSIDTHIMPQPLNISNQPNMKPVLEKICYSIKSIRQITQNKRQSCLEKSNSLPDFSSHVASTFGSSSKALLAFLAVMTLKEGITNLNGDELNVNNVSCAEALKMIDSLREIANIEDSHKLKTSLSDLQKSASKQLLESWRGFQEISDKCKSRSSTPNCSEQEFMSEASSEQGLEENVIDEMMSGLDIPETLKEELAYLSADIESESDNEGKTSADEAFNVKDVTQDDEAKVDIGSNIKNFTDINQLKQSNVEIVSQKTNLKQVSTDQATEDDDDDQHGQNCAAKYPPPVEHNIEQSSEERQLNSQEDEENQQQSHDEDTLSQEKANMSGAESCSSKEEEQDKECRQSEESVCIPESGSDDEGQRMSSANKDLEQKVSGEESISNSEAGEQQSSEEESEVQCEERKQESRESDLSDPEPHFEPPSTVYVKLNASSKGSNLSPDNENQSLSEEEQAEVERASNSDINEPSSSEAEQSEVERKELNAIVEVNLSEPEEEHESEEEHLDDQQDDKMKEFKETDEDKVNSEDEDIDADNIIRNVIESQDSPIIIKDSLIEESDTLEKHDSFNVEEDSGNDHSSCEELEPPKVKQISSSTEEELSCYDKVLSLEEEHANIDRHIEESCVDYQEAPVIAKSPEDTKPEKAIVSKSVAEKVSFLEKKSAQKITIVSQKNVPLVTDVEESPSESPTSEPAVSAQPVPQSSLSFSYDCSGIITTEPEGSRVKSIREMFLAKSSTDTQQGQRRLPSSNRSERVELRAETSTSGGYQSQTSSELSSGEDDSSRTTISKGFVRRTIERLYGKKDVTPEEVESERPPSAPKQKKKEQPNIFSPFHMARSKAMSELSYFNSTNALDTLSEATRCIAFNAQVGPGDSVPIDKGRWLLNESTLMRKSVSDPVGISKNCPKDEGICEDTAESTPYSLFNTKSEVEDTKKSFSTKCTYFSLPHASDSEVCQEELSTASKGSLNGDSITETKDNSEDTKTWAEKNGTLPIVSITDFKMKDNKVHPVTDNAVVAVQPKKGQTVVNRRPQEPDVLDIVYNFCGQNCPIL